MQPALLEAVKYDEISVLPKPESQYLVRIDPSPRGSMPHQFEVFDDCFIGGSRNRERERRLSAGMICFLAAVMRADPREVKVRWIMPEWNSIILRGSEPAIQRLLRHEQVIDFQAHLRMRPVTLDAAE